MFIQLTSAVSHLRLTGPAGMVTGVMDDLGRELVSQGWAVELTRQEFNERLSVEAAGSGGVASDAKTARHDHAGREFTGTVDD